MIGTSAGAGNGEVEAKLRKREGTCCAEEARVGVPEIEWLAEAGEEE